MSLLERVKELCEKRGVSINRFEKEAGLTRGSVAKWDDHAPSGQKLEKAASYFGVSVNYLLTGNSGLVAKRTGEPFIDVTESYDENGALIDTDINLNTILTGDKNHDDAITELLNLTCGASQKELRKIINVVTAMRKEQE